MSFDWSNVVGAGIGAIGNVVGGLASNTLSAYEQEQMARLQASLNYKYWKKQQLNQPSLSREGLEKANYNPMLALSNIGAGAGSSSWTSGSSYTAPDLSGVGNSTVNNALAVRQQTNQDKITESQVGLNNANSVLSQNRALTETYTQLEKMAHTDLMEADKILRDKQASYQDKQNAWYDKQVTAQLQRMQIQNKVDLMNAFSGQVQANSSMINAGSNVRDVESRIIQRKYQNAGFAYDNYIKGLKTKDFSNPINRSIYSYPGFHSPY